MSGLRTVSYGGGVQSTALLVLAAQGKIDFRTFLFANVGNDSERSSTLRYVREVAAPYAEAHGIDLQELHRLPTKGVARIECWYGGAAEPLPADLRGDGTALCPSCGRVVKVIDGMFEWHLQPETLWGRLTREGSRSLPIPVRMSNGAPGQRSCTADFKIRVIGRWLQDHGATDALPATVALGISADEIERAKPGIDPQATYQFRVYPLLDLGLRRSDCRRIISDAGLPVPDKSACFFCPFHDMETWRSMARDEPDEFEKACWLEEHLTGVRARLGKDPVFFTRFGIPLRQVASADQAVFDLGMDGCDSGWCMT